MSLINGYVIQLRHSQGEPALWAYFPKEKITTAVLIWRAMFLKGVTIGLLSNITGSPH
jgi:hypothetical protein